MPGNPSQIEETMGVGMSAAGFRKIFARTSRRRLLAALLAQRIEPLRKLAHILPGNGGLLRTDRRVVNHAGGLIRRAVLASGPAFK
jgi:hypothetical protein